MPERIGHMKDFFNEHAAEIISAAVTAFIGLLAGSGVGYRIGYRVGIKQNIKINDDHRVQDDHSQNQKVSGFFNRANQKQGR